MCLRFTYGERFFADAKSRLILVKTCFFRLLIGYAL